MAKITCDGLNQCYLRSPEGKLLQYDKTHLKVEGGILAGARLFRQLNCQTSPKGWQSVVAKPDNCPGI